MLKRLRQVQNESLSLVSSIAGLQPLMQEAAELFLVLVKRLCSQSSCTAVADT